MLLRDHGSQPLDAVLRSALEYAETGRPLPRVTVTDASVPEHLHSLQADLGRHLAHLRRCTSGRRPTMTHDGSRLDPPPTAPVQRADPPGGRRRVRHCRPVDRIRRRGGQQILPVPGEGRSCPRVSDRFAIWPPAPMTTPAAMDARPTGSRSAVRRRSRRVAMLDDVAWNVEPHPSRTAGAHPEAPGERPPRPRTQNNPPPGTREHLARPCDAVVGPRRAGPGRRLNRGGAGPRRACARPGRTSRGRWPSRR
jgi:hypothetical protein